MPRCLPTTALAACLAAAACGSPEPPVPATAGAHRTGPASVAPTTVRIVPAASLGLVSTGLPSGTASTVASDEEPSGENAPAAPAGSESAPVCALPAAVPPGLAIELWQHIVPHGANIEHRKGVFVDPAGACDPGVQCARLAPAVARRLWPRLRPLARLRHVDQYMSPHYGSRGIEVSWASGRCSYSDSSQLPLDDASRELFSDAFEALATELVAATKP